MNFADFSILLLVAVALAGALWRMRQARRSGKTCCGGCAGCPYAKSCRSPQSAQKAVSSQKEV